MNSVSAYANPIQKRKDGELQYHTKQERQGSCIVVIPGQWREKGNSLMSGIQSDAPAGIAEMERRYQNVVRNTDQKIMLLTASRLRCPVLGAKGGVPGLLATGTVPGTYADCLLGWPPTGLRSLACLDGQPARGPSEV